MQYRQNSLSIKTGNIVENYKKIKSLLTNKTKLLAVIKANAYGHGLVETAKALSNSGVDGFCIAILEEAIELRRAGIKEDIFLLGNINRNSIEDAILNNIVICVSRIDSLNDVIEISKIINKTALIQIAINTGMNRIGFSNIEDLKLAKELVANCPMVKIKLCFSHLAYCDEYSCEVNYLNDYTKKQIAKFEELSSVLDCPKSLANSAGIIRLDNHYDYARCGIIMYGYPPVRTGLELKKALEWHTEISNIMNIARGEKIGYGCTYQAERNMKVATISVGYGDGYLIAFSNKAYVIINGKFAKILGRVCMDQTMVDITDIDNVNVGDDVILIGKSDDVEITAEDLAQYAETISYEVLLSPSLRVSRKYID